MEQVVEDAQTEISHCQEAIIRLSQKVEESRYLESKFIEINKQLELT